MTRLWETNVTMVSKQEILTTKNMTEKVKTPKKVKRVAFTGVDFETPVKTPKKKKASKEKPSKKGK